MKVLTGVELDQMSDGELDAVVEDVAVFARVSPLHEHRIIQSLRKPMLKIYKKLKASLSSMLEGQEL